MKVTFLYFFIAFCVIFAVGFFLGHDTAVAPTIKRAVTPEVTISVTPAASSSAKVSEVKIFLVALNNSQSEFGPQFGCGDSVVGVVMQITSSMPLTAALTELLSLKTQYYGNSGLYNSLYQSDLKVSHADVTKGVATVYLTGKLQLGGVCDDPRVETQITKTIMQFPTVKQAKVYINNIPLHEAVSGK